MKSHVVAAILALEAFTVAQAGCPRGAQPLRFSSEPMGPTNETLTEDWTFPRYIDNMELCDIQATQKPYGDKYCQVSTWLGTISDGFQVVQNKNDVTCRTVSNTTTEVCSRTIEFIKDGIFCWYTGQWGPDLLGDDHTHVGVSAYYSPITFLNLSINKIGTGNVKANGVAYTGSVTVKKGGSVNLVAEEVPETGYIFKDWELVSGSVTVAGKAFTPQTSKSITVTLPSGDATLKAVFEYRTYRLTVLAGSHGTTTPISGTTVIVPAGAKYKVHAAWETGYELKTWSVVSGQAEILGYYDPDPDIVLSSGDATIEALFNVDLEQVVFDNDGKGSTNPDGVVRIPTFQLYPISALKTVEGYEFDHWEFNDHIQMSITDVNEANTTLLVNNQVNGDHALIVTAHFRRADVLVTIFPDGNGLTNPIGTVNLTFGLPADISATNATGYRFKKWIVLAGAITIANPISPSTTLTPSGPGIVEATFQRVYSVYLKSDGNGSFTQTSPLSVVEGEIFPVNAVPATGWAFQGWSNTTGTVQLLSPDNSPDITAKLAAPGDAVLTGVFTLLQNPVSGTITNSFSNSGIDGVSVTFTGADGKVFQTVTDADGNFSFPKIPSQQYQIVLSHPCYGTVADSRNITGPLTYQRTLSRQLSITASKLKIQVGENTDLSVGSCPEMVQESWVSDLSGAEEKSLQGKDITVSFLFPGFKSMQATVKYADGQQLSLTKPGYIEVVSCVPGSPSLKLSVEPKAAGGKVVDYCTDGLGHESVSFDADLIFGRCASGSPVSYQWTKNGASAGTGPSITLDITNSPKAQTVKVTATQDGKSNSASTVLELTECQLGQDGKAIMSTQEILLSTKTIVNGATVLETVPGENIQDDDGDVTVVGQAIFDPLCKSCQHQVTFNRWILTWKDDDGASQSRTYTPENVDIRLDQGFRQYTLTAIADVRDIRPGHNNLLPQATQPRLINVLPKIPLPKLGTCETPPFYCQEFYTDTLVGPALDLHQSGSKLEAAGTGFSGSGDDGQFSAVAVSGDFKIAVRIKTLFGQAGLAIRNTKLSTDKSLFLARSSDHLSFTLRERPSQDAIPYDFTASSATCLRITRSAGSLAFFGAPATGASCPDPVVDGPWGAPLSLPIGIDLSSFDGRLYVGLAAAGSAGNQVEFDNLFLQAGESLGQPAMIANTVFADGNLLRNWSFESISHIFTDSPVPMVRQAGSTGDPAYSGRFFGRITGKTAGQEIRTNEKLPLRVTYDGKSSHGIYIKLKVRESAFGMDIHPALVFLLKDGTLTTPMVLDRIAIPDHDFWTDWTGIVSLSDIPHADDCEAFYFYPVSPADVIASSAHVDFDDILIAPLLQDVASQNMPVTTLTFADGMTRQFQSVKLGEREDIVSAQLLDDNGRPARVIPVFGGNKNLDPVGFHDVRTDPVAAAMTYFNDNSIDPRQRVAESFVDIKPKWGDFRDESGREISDPSPLDRPVKLLGRSPAKDEDIKLAYTMSDDRTMGITAKTNGDLEKSHQSVEYKNAYGFSVKSEMKTDATDPAPLVSTMEPDLLGRIWSSATPRGLVTNYKYNTMDKLLVREDPDEGSKQMIYDQRGLLRFSIDGEKATNDQFRADVYDNFGRPTAAYLVQSLQLFTQDNADIPGFPYPGVDAKQLESRVYDQIPEEIPEGIETGDMRNLKGRLAASFSYNDLGTVASYFSYDDRGRIKTEWNKILALPLQRTDFTYNLAGQIVNKKVSGIRPDGNPFVKSEISSYDEFNRLRVVKNGDQQIANPELARFEYWPDGKVRYLDIGAGYKQGISYAYDASERLIKSRHEILDTRPANPGLQLYYPSNIFEQSLSYDLFGNISGQSYRLGAIPNPYRGVRYAYDQYDRLADVEHGEGVAPDNLDFTTNLKYNANYMYDEDGAISYAVRGKGNVTQIGDYAAYKYPPESHQLSSVAGSISSTSPDRSASDNFVYDANGNIILDRGAKKVMFYDYRNLPVAIFECLSVEGTGCGDVSSIYFMVYDADGNRVAKIRAR